MKQKSSVVLIVRQANVLLVPITDVEADLCQPACRYLFENNPVFPEHLYEAKPHIKEQIKDKLFDVCIYLVSGRNHSTALGLGQKLSESFGQRHVGLVNVVTILREFFLPRTLVLIVDVAEEWNGVDQATASSYPSTFRMLNQEILLQGFEFQHLLIGNMRETFDVYGWLDDQLKKWGRRT